jgi:hypothetical protein
MVICSAIKANGERCKGRAIDGSEYCWNHSPAYAEARRRNASRGGKRAGRGRPSPATAALAALRDENLMIRQRLLEGELLPGVAAVAIQSLNCDIRAVATTLKAKEQEDLEQRLEQLEQIVDQEPTRGARKWQRGR